MNDIFQIIVDDPLCCWCHAEQKEVNKLCCSSCQSLKERGLIEKDDGRIISSKIPSKGSSERLFYDIYSMGGSE